MDLGTIVACAACIVAGMAFLWTVYRDKTTDTEDLLDRVGQIETKIALAENSINRLETENAEMKKTLKILEDQINAMNLKVEKILTILENTKGA
ncbi:hypothetical protein [Pseudescherichia sp.]|uniref:hypothetical protein n=1 Tax=Pseudescherichia sp. TaxID=2055881 RepID=UPI00289AE89F|nr:hypothetical protein [Pseudescherichia sp.]